MALILMECQWKQLVGKEVCIRIKGRKVIGIVTNVGKYGVELLCGNTGRTYGETFREFGKIKLEWFK